MGKSHLSGWARLWIVATALFWLVCLVWLWGPMTRYPQNLDPTSTCYMINSPVSATGLDREAWDRHVQECIAELSTPEAIANAEDQYRFNIQVYWVGFALALAILLAVPLLVAGAFKIVAWIVRGFLPPTTLR